MLQHLPQENLIQILSFLLVQHYKYFCEALLVGLIEVFPSILFINKEIQQKIITSDYFINFINDISLNITNARVFRIYKYLNKITNNLIEIKNISFRSNDYQKIKSIIEKFTTIKNCNINIFNYFQSNNFLQKVENLTLNFTSYDINNLNSIKHFLSRLKIIYLPIDLKYFNNELHETIKLLQTNKVDIYLNVNIITNQSTLDNFLILNECRDVISTLNCNDYNDFNNIFNYKNLQRVRFSNIKSDIILKEMPYLSSINVFNCNKLVVSDCKNLKVLQITNIKYCDIHCENNDFNLLNLSNILNLNIKIDKIKHFLFRSVIKEINLQMKVNFVESFSVNYKFIKENAEILLKNNLNINNITLTDCNLNNNEVKCLQNYIINNVNLLRNINLYLNNDIYYTKLEVNDKKQFLESSQFLLIEKKDDSFIINNNYHYNIKTFTIIPAQYIHRNIKMVNFDSLLDLIVEATNISLDITELISLRSLTVLQENIINYNHLNLSKLIIKKNKNLNIKLNNLSNLKEFHVAECDGINLELENKRMKLQIIKLEKLRNVNINLKLNCPELYKFYFSCYEIESDIINFEFYNTPILFIPEIKILIK
ncbi:hypothetical protein ABK040_016120 [Willaertia magna]